MFSQFYVLSERGDVLLKRNFRGDLTKSTPEAFFQKLKQERQTAPIFISHDIVFLFLKRNGLFFVCSTTQNVNPAYCLEFLENIASVLKDFCGTLSEDTIRRNFILAYEILDEMIDCGYPQHTSTEKLKPRIRMEAVVNDELSATQDLLSPNRISELALSAVSGSFNQTVNRKTVPSFASHRPVGRVRSEKAPRRSPLGPSSVVSSVLELTRHTLGVKPINHSCAGNDVNEIFVDVLERITLVMNCLGTVLSSCVDGRIQIKSYLSGNPLLRIALNNDLCVSHASSEEDPEDTTGISLHSSSATQSFPKIDDFNFHESVNLSEFYTSRALLFRPPDGESIVMNYRITEDFNIPFIIKPIFREIGSNHLDLTIELRAGLPKNHFGGNLLLTCVVPTTTTAVSMKTFPSTVTQCVEYNSQEKKIFWSIKKLQGESNAALHCHITLVEPLLCSTSEDVILTFLRKEINPISLVFEIPMYTISGIQVKYLRIVQSSSGTGLSPISEVDKPFRWVRYVTQSNSYVCRL